MNTLIATEMDQRKLNPYAADYRDSRGKVARFRFPRSQVRDHDKIREAFKSHGLEVADISLKMLMWTYVLCTDGDLWLHDASHGGGTDFSIESRAKP